jgi:H+-transporting ATPase
VRSLVKRSLVIAGAWVTLSLAVFYVGQGLLHLPLPALQTLSFLVLVFAGQANLYLIRERRHFWRSRPSGWMLLATALDFAFVFGLAASGTLVAAVHPALIGELLLAVFLFMAGLDLVKAELFRPVVSPPA